MAHKLNVDIYAYDYSGYGASTGRPSEKNTYADITAVYDHIKEQGVDPQAEIILYGQSVGTGPSCYLAANAPVRGLVLHSPMTTGINVISNDDSLCAPANLFQTCDMFPNLRRIPHIRAPVYIMHGDCDEVIHVSHTQRLLSQWPAHLRHEPYIVGGAGHDDIFEKDPCEYFRRLQGFIRRTAGATEPTTDPPPVITMS
uniref:Serine aminopeptidase S33 domain-containing protein n=1 Tax=Pyramimonas obovata TaxID=1411642 RepID=A0A7S0N1S3_9CHLO